jgi:hypothetical protein
MATSGAGPPPMSGAVAVGYGEPLRVGTYWAETAIDVSSTDQTGLILRLQPASTVSGRVVLDGVEGGSPSAPISVAVIPVAVGTRWAIRTQPGAVTAEGTFTVRGVPPGRYRINAATPAPPDAQGRRWVLKSAMVGGQDAADLPFDIGVASDLAGVVITMSNRAAELTGVLQMPGGTAASDYSIVVFPRDERLWGVSPRRARAVRPASNGRYQVTGMPAGEYLLAALTDVDQGEWLNPDFLRGIAPAAIPIQLVEGERWTQDIRIGR